MQNYFTVITNFYGDTSPGELLAKYGSPLYVYKETVLRERCREIKGLLKYGNFAVNYSTKANSNLELLKIIRSEGLLADAMSPGELHVLAAAGYKPGELLYISNNVSREEMEYAISRDILVSIDSISQLRLYGSINPGGRVAVRINPGIGAGHHEKVVTAGKKTKFGINPEYIPEVKEIISKYRLKLAGINQHIGSLFMQGDSYLDAVRLLLENAGRFEDLDFIDMGGGFGVPYHKLEGQQRLDLRELGRGLDELIEDWTARYGKKVQFKIEPGRYISAECGVLLGTVHAIKQNSGVAYAGTDLGFNVLIRPAMYDSYHDIEVYRENRDEGDQNEELYTVVGNICESGDIIARERKLPKLQEGDILGITDAGAYGYCMASNYNNRLRPAEVLIKEDGRPVIIRRRDTLEDLLRNYE